MRGSNHFFIKFYKKIKNLVDKNAKMCGRLRYWLIYKGSEGGPWIRKYIHF